MKKIVVVFFVLIIMMMALCVPVFAENEGEENIREGNEYMDSGDYFEAGCSFLTAGGFYYNIRNYSEAAKWYDQAAKAFEKGGYDDWIPGALDARDRNLRLVSSIFSEGSLTIIVGIAAAVIFGLIGFFVGRKSKAALNDSAR